MRLPNSAHTSHPWRIHELTRDFELLDVWALPTPGGAGDFPRLVELFATFDPARRSPAVVRLLFAIREAVGAALGWDDPRTGFGGRVQTLRDRLPRDLRDAPAGTARPDRPFKPLYLTDDEWALEIVNRTVHGVLHLAWVKDSTGGYRGQMTVLVKPNGLLGKGYMAAISPFRHLIVYPAMMRTIGEQWSATATAAATAPASEPEAEGAPA
jgi:Protein of unknown function (DUF2867)